MKQVFDRPSATPSAIVIVGSGVVGTATGEGFLELGHDVTFVDISDRRVRELQDRGLNASTTVDLPADREAFIFLTLPTPNVGHRYDLDAFSDGHRGGRRALLATSNRCTPWSSDRPFRRAPATSSSARCSSASPARRAGDGFALASNPEFLRAASAAEDFR